MKLSKPQFVGEKVKLGELCDICSGGTPKRSVSEYWNEGSIPWVKISDISNKKYVYSTEEQITKEGLKCSSAKVLAPGTLLYSIFASIGAVGILEIPAATNQAIAGLSINTGRIERDYLYHYLKSQEMLAKSSGRGAAQTNINLTILRGMEVPVPPIDDQRAIAEQFEEVAAQIEKAKLLRNQLDHLVKSRFVEMFEGGQEWELRTLAECCATSNDIKCGPFGSQLHKEDYVSEGVPVWGIPEVNSNFERMPDKYVSPENGLRLQSYSLVPGDVAMNRKGNVGQAALFDGKRPSGIIHSDVLRVRVNQDVLDPVFLVEQLHSSHVVRGQVLSASTGAIMAGTNVTKLKKIKVFAPPLALQHEFANFVAQVDKSRFAWRVHMQLRVLML